MSRNVSINKTSSFAVSCPDCSSTEAITIDLNNLAGPITCDACGEQYTAAEALAKATEKMKAWEKVCRWLEMAGDVIAG